MSFPKIEGYVFTEKLGSGSYSTVYKAYTKVGTRSIVAIKCVDRSRLKTSGTAIDNIITEIRLLKTLTHPHIVQMKEFTWDDRNIYIIMEYCCGGDLSKYIHRYGRVPEPQVLYFLQQLASALKFLREKGVVHMDLKPHNLLLHKETDGKYILKVADFGFAKYMSEKEMGHIRGSPLYMAPEMVTGRYDASVDLWSVGVILYECLFGRAPYSSSTFKELVAKIETQAPIEIPNGSCVSPGCLDLLTRLLQHDPRSRISYEQFFAHQYLDMEHMPTKDNYEKAIVLIKQAIELDSGGQLERAFAAYTGSLLYLVPVVRCERDATRKAALTQKLSRYMERAEEIKEYLKNCKESNQRPADSEFVPPNFSRESGTEQPSKSTPQHCEQTDMKPVNINSCDRRTDVATCPELSSHIMSKTKNDSPSKFAFKRFFFRQESIPQLDANISDVQTDKKTEETNDACRIT